MSGHGVSNKANIGGHRHPYDAQWMAHWMRSSSSSASQIQKDCASPDRKRAAESKEAKMCSIEVMRSNIPEYGDVWKFNTGRRHLTSDANQQAEAVCIERGKFNTGRRHLTSDANQQAEAVWIERGIIDVENDHSLWNSKDALDLRDGSVTHSPSGSSADWENASANNFMCSENLSSDWNHFPMFDINRKIECILSSNRKSKIGRMAVRMLESKFPNSDTMLVPHEVKFASEEHHVQVWTMAQNADQGMGSLKRIQDSRRSPHYQVDRSGPNFQSSFNYQQVSRTSSLCTEKKTNPISSKAACNIQSDETGCTQLEHEQYFCSHSTFLASEKKDNNQMARGSSVCKLKNRMMQLQTNHFPDGVPQPFSFQEHGESSGLKSANPLPYEVQKVSNATQQFFLTKMGVDLFDDNQTILESTYSAEVKGTAIADTVAFPTMSCNRDGITTNLQLLRNSPKGKQKVGLDTAANFVRKKQGSSVETDGLHSDAIHSPTSTEGVTSFRSKKDISIFHQPSHIKHMKSQNNDADLLDVNKHPKFMGTDAPVNTKELSITHSVDVDHDTFHVDKKDNSQTTEPVENSLYPDSNNRWFKRLRYDPSGYFAHSTKKLKLEDAGFSNEVLNHKGSQSELLTCTEVLKKTDSAPISAKKCECSSEETAKQVGSWVRRWCHKSESAAPEARRTENMAMIPGKLEERELPSLGAMALMGKAISSFRPRAFRRTGSAVVWNTEESNSH